MFTSARLLRRDTWGDYRGSSAALGEALAAEKEVTESGVVRM